MAKDVPEAATTSWLRGVCPRTGAHFLLPLLLPPVWPVFMEDVGSESTKVSKTPPLPQTTQGLLEDQLPGG